MGIMQMLLAAAGGGKVQLAAYSCILTFTGGGTVTFTMYSDGTAAGDPANTSWYTPPTSNIGVGLYVVLTSVSGALTVSGTIGSRVQLSTNPSWTGSYSGGSVRNRTFNVDVYDAPTGGNLLGSGTLYMEIDGT